MSKHTQNLLTILAYAVIAFIVIFFVNANVIEGKVSEGFQNVSITGSGAASIILIIALFFSNLTRFYKWFDKWDAWRERNSKQSIPKEF